MHTLTLRARLIAAGCAAAALWGIGAGAWAISQSLAPLIFFGYLGTIIAPGILFYLGLPPAKRSTGRRPLVAAIGIGMLAAALARVLAQHSIVAVEGFFFELFSGIMFTIALQRLVQRRAQCQQFTHFLHLATNRCRHIPSDRPRRCVKHSPFLWRYLFTDHCAFHFLSLLCASIIHPTFSSWISCTPMSSLSPFIEAGETIAPRTPSLYVPGSWFSVLSSRFLVLGSRFSVLGSRFSVLRAYPNNPAARTAITPQAKRFQWFG